MKHFAIIGFALVVGLITAMFIFSGDAESVYARYGIEGLSTEEKVESLDKQILDVDIIGAGILERELVIVTEDGETSYPIDESLFYLSFAPYINQTHPCHNHNLVTCRSELAGETVTVYIESLDGEVLFDDTVTLYENGFKGVWLPSNIEATIYIEYGEYSVETDIATFDDSGTCLTEPLQLTK